MNAQSLYDNNIDTIITFQAFEHKQKYARKSQSRKNAKHKQHTNVGERKGSSKQGYKQARSMKRNWSEE